MGEVFADANYWFALFVPDDSLHFIARNTVASLPTNTRIITSDFVALEVLNSLARREFELKEKAAASFDLIRRSTDFVVVPCSRMWLERATALYLSSKDKSWSIVDCTSFLIMRDRGIRDALTYDRHFEQAGFRALLRHP